MIRNVVRAVPLEIPKIPTAPSEVRYVSLGDSYTQCVGATPEEAWPVVLTAHLRANGVPIQLIANTALSGKTTQDVIDQQLPIYRASEPTFATLLIGVNDYVQGVTLHTFKARLGRLMDQMLAVLPGRHRLVILTIPDFTVSPVGIRYAYRPDLPEGVCAFNAIIEHEAQRRGLPFIDIFPLSQQMRGNPHFLAADQLHPSAGEYRRWERVIFPVAHALLEPEDQLRLPRTVDLPVR